MKIGALVPARIGSKRLPKKNIRILGNKPLICWTIDVLLESDIFYNITVSTESDEIADVVRQYYSEKEVKILKRPKELAQDDSPLREVIYHYLERRPELDWYGLFMPTFPFRKAEKLVSAYNQILTRYLWKVKNVTEEMYCLLDFFYPVKEGIKRFFRGPARYCRYMLPVYVLESIDYPEETWSMIGISNYERTYYLTLTFPETIDIDTNEDFKLAEDYLKNRYKYNPLKLKETQINDNWIFIGPSTFKRYDLLLERFKDKLECVDMPLFVLKEKIVPVSFLNLNDGIPRNYIISLEARKKMINEKVIKTQNMQYFYKQYRSSSIFRFIRIRDISLSVGDRTDIFGQVYKSYDEGDAIIPWSRIIKEEKLLNIWQQE